MTAINPRAWLSALRSAWTRFSLADRIALGIVVLRTGLWLLVESRLIASVPGFLSFLFFLAVAFLLLRFLGWWRSRLLWSLRSRLVVAYLFIAVVPVLLLLTMVVISAEILYSQLGAYLLWDELHRRVEMLSDAGEHLVAGEAALPRGISAAAADVARKAQVFAAHDRDLPGLTIEFHGDPELFRKLGQSGANSFAGIVQVGNKLELLALRRHQSQTGGSNVVLLTVPVTTALLETMAADLGPIQLRLTRPVGDGNQPGITYRIGSELVHEEGTRVGTQTRTLLPPRFMFDFQVNGISNRTVMFLEPGGGAVGTRPVLAFFWTRVSLLNRRVFSSLGELGGSYSVVFVFLGIVFFIIEIAALITGIVLTRTITKAVADLYRATQFVQAGDLSHRVRIERKDQLGVLGESFNLMTSSVSNLIEEQRQRQKLDNELSIAREVQEQLFPQTIPKLPGVRLKAICRAARVVSGDYYDFLQLGPTRLGMAIADISGKGISAALLMASLQAALRSQVMTSSGGGGTAELVERLNRHLYLNTGDDRFATFFYAEYDTVSRSLTYTNAGHLPPLYICNGKVQKLDKGGMVLGVVDDYPYEQGRVHIEPGGLLIGYSDGLVEPENVYGEEFGIQRLAEVAMRLRDASPQNVGESLMLAAEEWAGTPEQADDMTVIVARMD